MMRPQFQPSQAREIAEAFERHGVDYLFIGKGGAILLGFPAMTQDIDVFPDRSEENASRILEAFRDLRFELSAGLEDSIRSCRDFVQIKSGPFDVDLVFAPDGISSFAEAKARSLNVEGFRVANLRDIIASKRASGRERDELDLPLLERFREEYERLHAPPLRSAADIAREREPES